MGNKPQQCHLRHLLGGYGLEAVSAQQACALSNGLIAGHPSSLFRQCCTNATSGCLCDRGDNAFDGLGYGAENL
ncbi:MAG TPA: hypothetical protein V6C82_02820 [Chroococcales cyanobacterium]